MNKHLASIICPVYNNWPDTKQCLKSISDLDYPKDKLEVIIVDNGSLDGTIQNLIPSNGSSDLRSRQSQISKLKTKTFSLKLIENKHNVGFAKAINQGIKISQGEYLLIINNDVVLAKNYLLLLVDYLECHSDTGIIGGKIYYQKPKNKLLFSGLKFNPWTGSINKLPRPNQIKETQWVQGCAMLIKKQVIDRIGLFDEDYFYSFEDFDFCQRAHRAGFNIIYNPKAIAWHKEGATIDKMGFEKKAYELYKSKARYISRYCSRLQIVCLLIIQFLIVAPYRKLILRDEYFFVRSMLAGYWYSLRH